MNVTNPFVGISLQTCQCSKQGICLPVTSHRNAGCSNHKSSTLKSKTLFGFPHLPPFLHPQIISQLATDSSMKFTSQALSDGFPLFINPMVNIEHSGNQVEASVLLTIPQISVTNSFCTLEYLTSIKFESSGVCYAGPVTKSDLVLISCPNSKQIVT